MKLLSAIWERLLIECLSHFASFIIGKFPTWKYNKKIVPAWGFSINNNNKKINNVYLPSVKIRLSNTLHVIHRCRFLKIFLLQIISPSSNPLMRQDMCSVVHGRLSHILWQVHCTSTKNISVNYNSTVDLGILMIIQGKCIIHYTLCLSNNGLQKKIFIAQQHTKQNLTERHARSYLLGDAEKTMNGREG